MLSLDYTYSIVGEEYHVEIEYQHWRNKVFHHQNGDNESSEQFWASNGVRLWSLNYPEYSYAVTYGTVCVRGSEPHKDSSKIIFPNKKQYQEFQKAVQEYNQANAWRLYNNTEVKAEDPVVSSDWQESVRSKADDIFNDIFG